MKNIVGKFTLATALMGVTTPVVSVAQNLASQVGRVNRDVERLTLLTGPNLLSPAHGAPQATPRITIVPASIKVGASPSFRFFPGAPSHPGQLPAFSEGMRLGRPAASEDPAPPASESLRFESAVLPTPVSLPTKTAPAPKRD